MSWQAAVIKFQCISVNVTYLFSFLYAVTRSWLAWSWELGFKAPPCESCQLIYLFLSSGSSWCVIQKLLKEWGWVNLWFSSFERTLEVLLHILPSHGSEIGLMRLIWSPFLRNHQCFCWKCPATWRPLSFLAELSHLWFGPWPSLVLEGRSIGGDGGKHKVRCEGQKHTCILSLSQHDSPGTAVAGPNDVLPMAALFCKACSLCSLKLLSRRMEHFYVPGLKEQWQQCAKWKYLVSKCNSWQDIYFLEVTCTM